MSERQLSSGTSLNRPVGMSRTTTIYPAAHQLDRPARDRLAGIGVRQQLGRSAVAGLPWPPGLLGGMARIS